MSLLKVSPAWSRRQLSLQSVVFGMHKKAVCSISSSRYGQKIQGDWAPAWLPLWWPLTHQSPPAPLLSEREQARKSNFQLCCWAGRALTPSIRLIVFITWSIA